MKAKSMTNAKPKNKKSGDSNPQDIEAIKSEVASFASQLGLSSSLPSSGFDDSDFRKSGPLKSGPQTQHKPNSNNKNEIQKPQQPMPKPRKNPFPTIDQWKPNKFKNLPRLPLTRASLLGVWYVDAAELEAKVIGENNKIEYKSLEEWKDLVEKKKELAEKLLTQYTHDYESSKGQSGDIKMVIATQQSGTAADKVSAFSVLVGDNPIANTRSLDSLLGMVTSKVGKRHALEGFKVLKELFVSSLLPDRKLKNLIQRPVNKLPESKDGYSLLLLWYWEECLKQRYERFIYALEEASRDMLPILKDKALKTIYALLSSKSEQERRLLSALVNKLGDPDNKSASTALFLLTNLLSDHPNMTAVVIDEVDSFLFRPHLGLRAKYNSVNFLTQIRLSHRGDGPKVAKRLVDVYFALFKVLLSGAPEGSKMDKDNKKADQRASGSLEDGKGRSPTEPHIEMDSRLLKALLTGVNRAFPFVSSLEANDIIEVQTPMLYQLVHSQNFNVGVQALMLLDKISSKNQIASDRFYRALYSKLLLPAAMNSSKEEMLIALLQRAMTKDVNLKRVAAFSKRLLQVTLQLQPQYACGCLFLLSEVLKARPPLWNMMLQNESIDEEIEHFEDILEDTEDQAKPEAEKPEDLVEVDHHSDNGDDDESDSEEDGSESSDTEDGASDREDFLMGEATKDIEESTPLSLDNSSQPVSPTSKSTPGGYNPRHREPAYCDADRVSWRELMVLASHVHPSVATMARTLLSGANIVYNGNPLNDLSLTAFLDKFMEKKPKQSGWHGGSQIEPSKKLDMSKHLIGEELLSLAEADVPPEDLVFHRFYANKRPSTKKLKKKKKAGDDGDEELFGVDSDDDSEAEEIDNLLDKADLSAEAEEYDYDDLDKIVDEGDDDLVGNVSDTEMEVPFDGAEGEDDEHVSNNDNDSDIEIGEVDEDSEDNDGDDDFKLHNQSKRKGKFGGASPFASLEDYEHLLKDDARTEDEPRDVKGKSKARRGKRDRSNKAETGEGSSVSPRKRKKQKKQQQSAE
ncbi:CCAAT-binding factor [Dillenia turbinata]|uniref:CCAAT-binding factor n=1 Tax=Dillenia turbinata TaxID=194707 RepID=A0AAN8UD71_9MAGN